MPHGCPPRDVPDIHPSLHGLITREREPRRVEEDETAIAHMRKIVREPLKRAPPLLARA